MERVIKFRAWNPEQKVWEYNFEISPDGMVGKTNMFETYELKDWLLCQFTGLTDKNSNEAYVGCIYKETLLNGEERFYKIFEVEGGFAINTFQDDFYKPSNQIQFWTALSDMQTISWFKSNLEEIGNTYENPELLSTDKTKTV